MNIFYYAARRSTASSQYIEKLLALSVCEELLILPEGSCLLTPTALKLRSGDIIILYAADSHELDELIRLRNEFTNFRIFVILGNDDPNLIQQAQILSPRFIAHETEIMNDLEVVMKKTLIIEKSRPVIEHQAFHPRRTNEYP